jgi:hypothetical protein
MSGDTVNKLLRTVMPMVICFSFLFAHASAEQSISVGYGFGLFNQHGTSNQLDGGDTYDFIQAMYSYERPVTQRFSVLVEPFVAFVNRPTDGFEGGVYASGRYYIINSSPTRLYVSLGGGLAYTSVAFKEQGTHLLFALQGSIGVVYKGFFLENRFRHYSNGNTSSPNRSVHANIVSVGMYF